MSETPSSGEPYEVSWNPESHLLVVMPTGSLSKDGVMQVVDTHYPRYGGESLKSVLWDLRACTVAELTGSDFSDIARNARAKVPASLRRTAYLVGDLKAFTRVVGYLNQTVAARVPVEYNVFLDEDSALVWLGLAQ